MSDKLISESANQSYNSWEKQYNLHVDSLRNAVFPPLVALTLGFIEGCLHYRRRPISLRFAVAYAAWNVVPTFVWRGVNASTIAHALCIPSTLIISSKTRLEQEVSAQISKRLLLIQTMQSVRFFTGTCGLLFAIQSFWEMKRKSRTCDHLTSSSVVNLHASHEERASALSAIHHTVVKSEAVHFVEIQWAENDRELIMNFIKEATRRADRFHDKLYRIGLVSGSGFSLKKDASLFDVYFSPVSIISKALQDHYLHCHNPRAVIIYLLNVDESSSFYNLLAKELVASLLLHGIYVEIKHVCTLDDVAEDEKSPRFDLQTGDQIYVHKIIAAKSTAEVHALADGILRADSCISSSMKSCLVVEDSLEPKKIELAGFILLSLQDLCQKVCEQIRADLIKEQNAEIVQSTLRRRYGPINSKYRNDHYSDITKYVY